MRKIERTLCGLHYYRESGYFTGAMYLDYIVSAVVVASLYFLSLLLPDLTTFSSDTKRLLWIVFGILVALASMRHAYSFWLAMDFYFSPGSRRTRRLPQTNPLRAGATS